MKKLHNPFQSLPGYNCFGCSPENKIGLKLEFFDAGDEVVAWWKPRKDFEGWLDVVHGGIQTTLMDELASWVIFVKRQSSGVTSHLDVSFLKPVHMSAGKVKVTGRIVKQEKRITTIHTQLYDGGGILCTEGNIDYFVFPEKVAKEKFYYQGLESFYQNK
jgi:uncharacterized protein (TIGR00369 family)